MTDIAPYPPVYWASNTFLSTPTPRSSTEVAESGLTMTDRRVKLAKMDADVAAVEES